MIIRILLTLGCLCDAYHETGVWTTLCLTLIWIGMEVSNGVLK